MRLDCLKPLIPAVRAATFAVSAAIPMAVTPLVAWAEPPVGEVRYLCCNMRAGSDWISDINYDEEGMRVLPFGTPAKVLAVSGNRILVEIEGKTYKFNNDYSRKLGMAEFIRRYLLAADPRPALKELPDGARKVIESFTVVPGMTRDQVLLAIAYPIADETPDLKSDVWKYWRDSTYQYDLKFDAEGRVRDITVSDDNNQVDEKCAVNVYRPERKFGDDATHTYLQVDNAMLGRLRTSDTYCLKLAPGKHLIEVRHEYLFMPAAVVSSMEVTVPASDDAQFLRFHRTLTVGSFLLPGALFSPFLSDNKMTLVDEESWRKRK
jgi:hypothetical protein